LNLSGFWVAFLAGVASAVVVGIGTVVIRRALRKASEDSKPFSPKQLRALIVLIIGLVLLLLPLILQQREQADYLIVSGMMLIFWGIWDFV